MSRRTATAAAVDNRFDDTSAIGRTILHDAHVATEHLVIDVASTFRGPLAKQLVDGAAAAGKEPVVFLADLVERGLGNDERLAVALRHIDTLNEDLTKLRQGTRDLRFANDVEQFLKSEAHARRMNVQQLLHRIIEVVVEDRLFTAVLDK